MTRAEQLQQKWVRVQSKSCLSLLTVGQVELDRSHARGRECDGNPTVRRSIALRQLLALASDLSFNPNDLFRRSCGCLHVFFAVVQEDLQKPVGTFRRDVIPL